MNSRHYRLFRIFTSAIFLYAGIGHLVNQEKIISKLSATQFYQMLPANAVFPVLVFLSGVVMIAAAIMLATGIRERLAATALLLVLIPITLSVQLNNLEDLGPFFKNVAIAGSLLLIMYNNKPYENKNMGIIPGSTVD